jgi:hypothetical protein
VFALADLRAALAKARVYLGDTVLQLAFAPILLKRWENGRAKSS